LTSNAQHLAKEGNADELYNWRREVVSKSHRLLSTVTTVLIKVWAATKHESWLAKVHQQKKQTALKIYC